jgi:hypothetical protein
VSVIRLVACLCGFGLLLQGAAQAAPPHVAYARTADAVVIEFSERPGELAVSEPALSLRIYGDGRYVALRPRGMRNAGEHAGRLTPADLHALLVRFAARGVFEFDSTRARRPRLPQGGRLAPEMSDPSELTLVLRASRAGEATAPPAEKRISVQGLRAAARAEPDDAALAGLAQSCAELRGLIDAAGAGASQ